jgi:hypothetical protein
MAARATSPDQRGGAGIDEDAPRGSRSGIISPRWTRVSPTYLALVSSERLCPRETLLDQAYNSTEQHAAPLVARTGHFRADCS